MEFKRLSFKHGNNKFLYYLTNYLRQCLPNKYYQKKLNNKLKEVSTLEKEMVEKILFRVNYYNKLDLSNQIAKDAEKLAALKLDNKNKTYFFDLHEYTRFFNQNLKLNYLFGDIVNIPKTPTIVKSRPIGNTNANSIILNLNKIRHFIFIKTYRKDFSQKKNMLISRGKVHASQLNRIKFLEQYFEHPLCNIGMVNLNNLNSKWKVNRMTIEEQLNYKFILCLEGNDVATNLKWVMSSNSIAVMPKPKYETWFMEGLLIPDKHYICIKDDFSDLEKKLNYFIDYPNKATEIIQNANDFVSQFKNKKLEDLVALMVMNKYFQKTNQI